MSEHASAVARSNLRGIAFIVVGGIFVTATDTIAKWLAPHYPVGEILFVHALLVMLLVTLIAWGNGWQTLRVIDWRSHVGRGTCFTVSSFALVLSLRYLPLAEVVAVAFAGPLIMTLLARAVLHETVGAHRLGAVLVGFVGILLVVNPGRPQWRWMILLPLVIALADACRDVWTRKMTSTEGSLSVVMTTTATVAVVSLATAFFGWRSIEVAHLGFFVGSAVLFVAAQFCMVEGFRFAQAVAVAPFRYIQLLWGVVIGFLIWGDVPTTIAYIGMLVTVAAGVYIAHREARLARS